jgi:hypothetical protein
MQAETDVDARITSQMRAWACAQVRARARAWVRARVRVRVKGLGVRG